MTTSRRFLRAFAVVFAVLAWATLTAVPAFAEAAASAAAASAVGAHVEDAGTTSHVPGHDHSTCSWCSVLRAPIEATPLLPSALPVQATRAVHARAIQACGAVAEGSSAARAPPTA
ncbi:MAG: DUF2946 family protein [Gemmatimonadaceae bacterium]|nr:DUF2946 family protein [Gemmatimonadaceae bacterium]